MVKPADWVGKMCSVQWAGRYPVLVRIEAHAMDDGYVDDVPVGTFCWFWGRYA